MQPREAAAPVLLSRADHPATGDYCWFLHPCETESMVDEVLAASREERERDATETAVTDSDPTANTPLTWEVEWLEAWLMVVGGLVDLIP